MAAERWRRATGCVASITAAALVFILGAPSPALASGTCTAGAVAYAPAQGVSGMVLFEDLWTNNGDLDFNDQTFAYNYQFLLDANCNVVTMQAAIDVLAVGAGLHNGAYLHLPLPRASTPVTVVDQHGNSFTPIATETDLVFSLVNDTRSLFATQYPFINTEASLPVESAAPLNLTITFTSGVPLDTTQAPFDLFIARSNDFTYQIHLPEYSGTNAMNRSLFGQGDDRSNENLSATGGVNNTGRWFVNENGLPFALTIPETIPWPQETVSIENVYKDLTTFASSGGTEDTDWYSDARNINSNLQYTHGAAGVLPPTPQPITATLSSDSVALTLNTVTNPGSTGTQPAVCGTYTLTGYTLDSSGNQTYASFNKTVTQTAASTTVTATCTPTAGISGAPSYNNYRYVVVANNFGPCSGASTPLSSSILPSSESFNIDVKCSSASGSGTATSNVWVPSVNSSTGAIDIGTIQGTPSPGNAWTGENANSGTVSNATCSKATLSSGSNGSTKLGFAESYTNINTVPWQAYTGVGIFPNGSSQPGVAPSWGTVSISASDATTIGSVAKYSGALTLPAAPASGSTTVEVLQGLFGEPCGEVSRDIWLQRETFIQPNAAECLTTVTIPSSGTPTLTTTAMVAQVFVAWDGSASVSAFIGPTTSSGSSIQLYTSLQGPNFSLFGYYVGSDNLTRIQTLPLPGVTVLGVYGSEVHYDELLAVVQSSTSPQGAYLAILTLNDLTGVWSVTNVLPPESGALPLSHYDITGAAALGLFNQDESCSLGAEPECASTGGVEGSGGPSPLRAPSRPPEGGAAQLMTSGGGAQATVNVLLEHGVASGNANYPTYAVAATNPTVNSQYPLQYAGGGSNDYLYLEVDWSVNGLQQDESAYAAITLCNPIYVAENFSGTNAGSSPPTLGQYSKVNIGNSNYLTSSTLNCKDYKMSPLADNSYAFWGAKSGATIKSYVYVLASELFLPCSSVTGSHCSSLYQWQIPINIYKTTGAAPNPDNAATDTNIYSSVLQNQTPVVPIEFTYNAGTIITLNSATEVAAGMTAADGTTLPAGILWKFTYEPGLGINHSTYLQGQSKVDLMPPAFYLTGITNGSSPTPAVSTTSNYSAASKYPPATSLNSGTHLVSAQLVPHTAVCSGTHTVEPPYNPTWGCSSPTLSSDDDLNSNYDNTVALTLPTGATGTDPYPSFQINNMVTNGGSGDIAAVATWFSPAPTVAGTMLVRQAQITWVDPGGSSHVFVQAGSGGYYENNNYQDVSPIQVLAAAIHVAPPAGGYNYEFNFGPQGPAIWNYEGYSPIGTQPLPVGAGGGSGYYWFTSSDASSSTAPLALNPDYVISIPQSEQVISTSITANLPYAGSSDVWVSKLSSDCDPATFDFDVTESGPTGVTTVPRFGSDGSVIPSGSGWTDVTSAPTAAMGESLCGSSASAPWTCVRCLRYRWQGYISPPTIAPFYTGLISSVYAAGSVGSTPAANSQSMDSISFFAATDNAANGEAKTTLTSTWEKTTNFYVEDKGSVPQEVYAGAANLVTDVTVAGAYGVPYPGLTLTFTLPPNAIFDTSPPLSWLGTTFGTTAGPLDVAGHPLVATVASGFNSASSKSITISIAGSASDCGGATPTGCYARAQTLTIPVWQAQFTFSPKYYYDPTLSIAGRYGHSLSLSTSTPWAPISASAPLTFSNGEDVTGGSSISALAQTSAATSATPGQPVAFNLGFSDGNLSGVLGENDVALYDFIGYDYVPSSSGVGTLQPQSAACTQGALFASVSATGSSGSHPAGAPTIYYMTNVTNTLTSTPPFVAAGTQLPNSTWLLAPNGIIPSPSTNGFTNAGVYVTGIMIVPNSGLVSGQAADGIVIPGNGTETYQVNLTPPTYAVGSLCNSAVVVAPTGYTVAPEVDVPVTAICDSTPWPIGP